MILSFAEVLTPDEHRKVLDAIGGAPFADGRATAGERLADTKHNEQIASADATAPIAALVLAALKRHEPFRNATYPKQMHSLMVSRYRPGMRYGPHVDEPLMGGTTAYRTDLSLTLFLAEPSDYDGGELAIESGSGELRIRLPARSMVTYPTGQLHQVLPVTRGERLAVVAWIESFVRDAGARETLWDLAQAREDIHAREGKSRAYDLVAKSHANLLRRWAET